MTSGRTNLAVDHVGMVARDRDATVAWYQQHLGFQPIKWEDYVDVDDLAIGLPGEIVRLRGAQLDAGSDTVLEIHEYVTPTGDGRRLAYDTGPSHIAFTPVDMADDYARLAAAGVVWHGKPKLITTGALAGDEWVWGNDPFGTPIELHVNASDEQPADRITLNHYGLTVPDLDAAAKWYCETYGWKIRTREAWTDIEGANLGVPDKSVRLQGVIFDTGGPAGWELHEYASGRDRTRRICDTGIGHAALWADDVSATYADLKGRGVRFNHEVGHITTGGLAGTTWAYGRDLNDNVVEITSYPV